MIMIISPATTYIHDVLVYRRTSDSNTNALSNVEQLFCVSTPLASDGLNVLPPAKYIVWSESPQ